MSKTTLINILTQSWYNLFTGFKLISNLNIFQIQKRVKGLLSEIHKLFTA